jgi:predicted flap endonuclease-1-like 5' DNA nuclease
MTKKRPFGITILAVLIGIAALFAVYHTLQFLHILPFSLGPIKFFAFDLIGALLWGIDALILIWVVSSLWNMQMGGRIVVAVVAIVNLILIFLSIIGQSTFSAMLPALLVNLIILIYLLLPSVTKAFEEASQPAPAAAAPVAATRAAMDVPAPVAPATPAEEKTTPVVPAMPVEEKITPVAPATPSEEKTAPVMGQAAVPLAAAAAAITSQETPVEPEVAAGTAAAVLTPQEVPVDSEAAAVAAALAQPAEEAPAALEAAAASAALVQPVEEAPAVPEAAAVVAAPVEGEAAAVPAPSSAARPKVKIETIEGIGPVFAARLKELGIQYVADLLDFGASRKGRDLLVEKTGISGALILKWVNMADLMRVPGIGEEFSELLEYAGVDTVKELRNRNPENLFQAMVEASKKRNLVRRTPYLSEVQSWVEHAKKLDPVVTY